ncbi:hypothetical protein ANTRET_LOCUS5646 [Anthophora retusa]
MPIYQSAQYTSTYELHQIHTNSTLTVYKSKPKVKVLLLSIKHRNIQIEDNCKRVPETVTFYNKTKFGVDVADQVARKYSVKAGCFRWPLQVFYNILDLAAINAWILYKECTGSKISRKEFIFCLAEELAGGNEEKICQSSDVSVLSPSTSGVRKSCHMGYCIKNRSNNCCMYCKKIVCGKRTNEILYICKKCAQ